ncbi:Fic/DOC family N-terminal domain-containing protein, partial [Kaistella sp.]|uniref:Fic/DOC family N-terminal domain-containing protein n=1 Tax=Kaistella sp. TaxID=2782235 RepID=UPI003C6F9DE1
MGRLDFFSQYVNIDLFISMHIVKETTQSTKIEGTQTNMEETFLQKEDLALDKRDDWDEVQNYILAMKTAANDLEKLPISARLIKNTHKTLISGVTETAKIGVETFDGILKLQRDVNEKLIQHKEKTEDARKIVSYLYE